MNFDKANLANYEPTWDMEKRPLWNYAKSVTIYKCPADRSYVMDYNNNEAPRILTMSMNLYVGGFAPLGDDGGWHQADPYWVFRKSSGIINPSSVFLFLDMREDVVNWSNFMVDMTGGPIAPNPGSWTWGDMPGDYHNRACGFSFTDGHSEIKRWLDGRTTPSIAPPLTLLSSTGFDFGAAGKNNQDVYWTQLHSTVAR